MIIIRNDDVLGNSGEWVNREVERLKRIHSWISEFPNDFIHVPTIVVNDIIKFPEAVEFVKQETDEGRMMPEIHGLDHIDYCNATEETITDHMEQCLEWFDKTLEIVPTKLYTPWGGWNKRTADIVAKFNLTLVGVDTYWSLEAVCARLGKGGDIKDLHGHEIFMHWWNRGIRLKRLAMAVKYGSWEAAKQAEESKEYF